MAIKILGDIVSVVSEHISNPSKSGYHIFVGLEHYDSGEPVITRHGSTEQLESSVKHFIEGDILVARRNVYLKRAGVVNFEGVTSGDSIVLRVKEEKYKDIIPFILNTDDFWDYAEQNSDGTMSKRLAPDVLLEYECNIPENHQSIADKLWAAYKLKVSYKQMITATDEMVKSQFIGMFGTLDEPKVDVKRLRDVVNSSGQYGSNSPATDYELGMPRYIRITDINDDGSLNDDIRGATDMDRKYKLMPGDIVFARTGATVGKTYLHESGDAIYAGYLIKYQMNPQKIRPAFLMAYTHSRPYYNWVSKTQKVGAQPNISAAQYDSMPVLVPTLHEQDAFLTIYKQADKSKFELRKSIEAIDAVIKSLING